MIQEINDGWENMSMIEREYILDSVDKDTFKPLGWPS